MRVVPVEFALNNELAASVYDVNGRMLVKSGSYLTDNIMLKIKSNGIFSVYINDRFSKNTLEAPISDHLKNVTILEMYKVCEAARRHKESKSVSIKEVESLMSVVIESARDIMYELERRESLKLNYVDIKSVTTYTYAHPINVAILSYILARKLGLSAVEKENIFVGAMFADIGMSFINENLFMKQGKLDLKEFIKVKEHPQLGYDFVKDFYFANTYVKMIILQHQEKIDGSGYPNNTKGDKIYELAKLVAVADVYDAMTSDRVYARATTPAEAIEYIMGAAGRHFDFKYAKEFVNSIEPYPVGSLIKLNTGQIALVERSNIDLPLRPIIKLIDPVRKILEKSPVDLTDEKNLVIERLEYVCP